MAQINPLFPLLALGLGALALGGSGGGSRGSRFDPLSGGTGGGALEDDEGSEDDYEPDPTFYPDGPNQLPDDAPDLDPDLWDVDQILPGTGTPPPPLIVGFPDEPQVAVALDELDQFLSDHNVGSYTDAEELTTMLKAPGQPVAVPAYSLWENMLPTLWVWDQIRNEIQVPMALRAYRPADYNLAVGGAKNSLHQWFSELDIRISGEDNTSANRLALALAAARYYKQFGGEYDLGFGAYGSPVPGNIHLDSGWKKRTWDDGAYYVNQV